MLEDRLRAHWLVSQCMVVGDQRPFVACLVTLDESALADRRREHHKTDVDATRIRTDPALLAEVQLAVDEANKAVSKAESIRTFAVTDDDFHEAAGQLIPPP